MNERRRRVQVRLHEADADRLDTIAARTKRSTSNLVESVIQAILDWDAEHPYEVPDVEVPTVAVGVPAVVDLLKRPWPTGDVPAAEFRAYGLPDAPPGRPVAPDR